MQAIILTLLFVGCALSAVVREKRQTTTCQEPDIPNVCLQAGGRIYFPHPTNNMKFLQCGDGARMFIITCPKGEMYDQAQTKCVSKQTNPGTTMNMCTAANLASGNIFFPYASDKTKFIECNAMGQPTVLSCPSRLVYDAGRKSCVLPAGTVVNGGTTGTGTNTGTSTGTSTGTNTGTSTGTSTGTNTGTNTGTGTTNPCAGQAATSGNLFFPHPDPTKFIQCDLAGDAYVMQCPAGLVWSQGTSNCQSAFLAASGTSGTALVG